MTGMVFLRMENVWVTPYAVMKPRCTYRHLWVILATWPTDVRTKRKYDTDQDMTSSWDSRNPESRWNQTQREQFTQMQDVQPRVMFVDLGTLTWLPLKALWVEIRAIPRWSVPLTRDVPRPETRGAGSPGSAARLLESQGIRSTEESLNTTSPRTAPVSGCPRHAILKLSSYAQKM